MAINSDAGRIHGAGYDLQALRQNRATKLEARVQEATLAPTKELSSKDIKEHQGFYNNTVGDIDGIRGGGGIAGGILGGLNSDWMDKMFPAEKSSREVDKATRNHIFDNKDAKGLREDYNKTHDEARRERAIAVREADKMGPGDHTLSNGDKVNVSVDKETGKKTVTTESPDGSTKTVTFDSKNPDSVNVSKTDSHGNTTTLDQQGTTVTKSESNMFGQTTSNEYSLDKKGNPVRETTGPGEDDYKKTTANGDGSTDTRNLIYKDENGKPVYEDKHEDPSWKCPDWPKPQPFPPPFPHPHWPFPIPQPEPGPWWRKDHPPILFMGAEAQKS